jgi:hypothetical protein
VKIIHVRRGQRTSLQYHARRSELHIGWEVIPWGQAYGVDLDRPVLRLVRPFKEHRMQGGTYIEIAWGRPREDDIVRVEDDYSRQ